MGENITCCDLSLSFSFGKKNQQDVIKNANANFPAGKISVLTGAVGTGKSTLLHILAGLLRPTSGEVIVGRQAVSRLRGNHRVKWRQQVGMIFQHYHLINDLTVLENIMLPLVPLGYTLSDCRNRAKEAIEKVGLQNHASKPVHYLSGGERQKTALARALINQPKFIFADEPTAHQDAANQARMLELLYGATKNGAVVVLASHESNITSIPGEPEYFHLEDGLLQKIGK